MKTIKTCHVLKSIIVLAVGIALIPPFLHAQWYMKNVPTVENLIDVVMLDSVTAVVIGDRNAILRTTDAGVTWTNITIAHSADYHWNAVSFSDKLNGTIVGDHTLWTTTDGGATWISRTVPSTQKCFSVKQLSPRLVYIGCDSGYLYHSSDTCRTWSVEKISSNEIRSIFIWTGPIIPEAGIPIYALTPSSLCMSRIFPFLQWKEDTLTMMVGLGSEALNGEFSYGGGPGYIVGVQGDLRADPTILVKKISDTVWTKVQTGILRDGVLYDVSAPSDKFAYVCGSGGMILNTTDGGTTWKEMIVPTARRLKAISFFNNERGFAVGDSGTVLFTSNGGITDVTDKHLQLPERFELFQNYPNPFNPTTTIRFRISTSGFTSLKVFDVLGREVATLVNKELSAGEHSVQWNATEMPSGIYLYRLESGTNVSTRKLVLVK